MLVSRSTGAVWKFRTLGLGRLVRHVGQAGCCTGSVTLSVQMCAFDHGVGRSSPSRLASILRRYFLTRCAKKCRKNKFHLFAACSFTSKVPLSSFVALRNSRADLEGVTKRLYECCPAASLVLNV